LSEEACLEATDLRCAYWLSRMIIYHVTNIIIFVIVVFHHYEFPPVPGHLRVRNKSSL